MVNIEQAANFVEKKGFLFISQQELSIVFLNTKYYTFHELFFIHEADVDYTIKTFSIEDLENWCNRENLWINKLLTHQQNHLC